MKHRIRRQFDIALTGLGIGIIFTAVLLGGNLQIGVQLPLALLGVLLMEAGVWGLSGKFLPNQRRFTKLREEGDRLIRLLRDLNEAAIAKRRGDEDVAARFDPVLDEMHECVNQMARLAGRTDAELAAEEENKAAANA